MKKEKTARRRRQVKYDRRSNLRRIVELLLASLVLALVVEGFNQGSSERMLRYLTERTMYYALNWLVVLASLSIS